MGDLANRLTWRLWSWVSGWRGICPANLHSLMIWHYRRDPRIDWACRQGLADNGACWCGKLRTVSDEFCGLDGEVTA